MAPKRAAPSTPGSSEKKRKVLSLAQKMEVIEAVDGGLGWTQVGKKGFDDMTEDDVAEIIDSHDVEPSVEELIQLQEEEARDGHDDEEEEGEDTQTRPVFTIRQVRNLLRETEKLTSLFIDQDPLLERSMKFKRGVNELLLPYKETLRILLL